MTFRDGSSLRVLIWVILCLGGIHGTAPWPLLQTILHALLVLGLAPLFPSRLVGVFWSALAGWVLEGTLRMYPQLGGTGLANMLATLAAAWCLIQWPPLKSPLYWARLAGLTLGHTLLMFGCVRLAAGPQGWSWYWLAALATVPLWGTLSLKLYRLSPRR